MVSPKLLKWRMDRPEVESPAMKLGTALHCAVFEPAEFPKRWVVAGRCAASVKSTGLPCGSQGSLFDGIDWYCKVRGHATPTASEKVEGVEIVTLEQLEVVRAAAAAIADHKVASRILSGGLPEHELEWQNPETGILCRGRLDYLKPREVVDLKSTVEETLWGIRRKCATMAYHAQLAWYHDGAIAAGRLQPDAQLPALVAVQTVEPYDVAVFRMNKADYEAGQICYRDLLLKFRDCQITDDWYGIARDVQPMNLPDWAPGMNGSNYDEVAFD